MALPHQPPAADAGPLERFVRKAIWRIRLERLRLALGVMVWIALAAATVWTAGLLWRPDWALGAPIGVGLIAALLFIAADVSASFPGRWTGAASSSGSTVNSASRMPPSPPVNSPTMSATIGGGASSPRPWIVSRRVRGMNAGRGAGQAWSVWAPPLSRCSALCSSPPGMSERAEAQPALTPFQKAQFQALEEVFKDWDEAAKKTNDPKLREQLALMKSVREQMLAGKIERQRGASPRLSRLEEKLQSARERAQGAIPRTLRGGTLASALEPFQGMSAMAAALRRKDFGEAEKLAQEQAEKLGEPGAKLPEGSEQRENQLRLTNTAQTMQQRGQKAVSEALQKMEQGMQDSNNQQTSQGLEGLKKSFGDQAKRDAEKQRLATQLAQMGAAKDSLGSGKSVARGMSLLPKLADSRGPHGNGAGSEIDPNRFGAETKLTSNRTEEKVTGDISDGDSVITTEKSLEHSKEAPSVARQAHFQEYEKLSREAIEDESIPLAHREAIRKYFEMIRPAEK